MYRLAICDDFEYDNHMIRKEIESLSYQLDISSYNSPLQLLKDFKANPFNIVCLDIEMPEISGFELAEKLKSIYRDVLIVFITSHDGLIRPSIKYRPIGFISKNDFSDLENIFNSIINELTLIHATYACMQDNIVHNINLLSILYFQKKGNDLLIYTTDALYKFRKSLKDVEKVLNPNMFIRINKSIIVNASQIRSIDNTNRLITLTTNEKIPFSRTYKNTLIEYYRETIMHKI